MPAPDFSQPISKILREGTTAAHEAIEYSPGSTWLSRGELDKSEYTRLLMMLWHVYNALESALETHAGHPVLQHTHDPVLLARAPALAEDIAFFLRCPVSTWQSNPAHTALLLSHPAPLEAYESRIRALSESGDAALLLAHAYVRYLGDLSGGQIIQRRVARAYDLDVATGDGMRFYKFGATDEARSTKQLKEWYRAGMNTGVGDDAHLKAEILAEANHVFELNMHLYSLLSGPSSPSPRLDTKLALPILGDASPTQSDFGEDAPKEIPVEIVQSSSQPESLVSLGSVIAVVVAVCLAHFLLVTSGLTGTAWTEKLESMGLVAPAPPPPFAP
ncbi:heme oxygenase-like protein [Athelia psychrophila]|uniref:Heme oxygenase-like protein n=1 Tax=Athelia psychrophila TaxID=1759441 RepID=A0A166DIJ3_9AGAM|nr:heme oxygenase-like protein [Fibularhizoctonia sp. CBS 109695]